MSRKLGPLMLLVLSFGSAAHAASEVPVIPTADKYPVSSVHQIGSFTGAPLDLERLGEEDKMRDDLGQPQRFAVPQKVFITPATHGTWEDLADGQMLWRLRILGGEGTNSLNLGFTKYKMVEGGRLLLYSTDGTHVVRPFTVADNEDHGELWTPVITSRDIVVELTVPKASRDAVVLELGSVNQGYRGFGTITDASYDKSGSCNMDVECLDPNDPWRDEVRASGVISTGGSTFCSGSLVNNTANDHKMYFVTANHCSINAGNAASLVVFWNYENSFCRTPGSAASGQAGDGSLAQFHTGSFHRASWAASDITLVELDDPAVLAFNHRWAGWDRSTGDFTCSPGVPCAAIHHPSTDEKRFTYATTNTATTTYLGTTSPGNGTHVWVHWATDPPGPFTVPGVTEGGSSGSPLYNADRRFIGQLHGGLSACGATGDSLSDYYGRFNVSWTGGGADNNRVSNWLDPLNTGATTIDGIDSCTSPGAPTIGTATATAPNQIQVTWSDGAPPSSTFKVYRAIGTCASPGTFVPVGTALAGSPFTDNAVSGGTTYAYHVTGSDPTGGCESVPSACVQATATGSCTLPPTFDGLESVSNNGTNTCGLTLSWDTATANCGGPVTYSVYRSTTSGFTPGPGNLLEDGISGTSYADSAPDLANGVTYHYVVRATDATNSSTDTNTVQRSAAPSGPITLGTITETFEGSLSGGGFDNPGWTHAAVSGSVDWVHSTIQPQTPTHSWFSDSQTAVSNRVLVSPEFVPQAGTTLSFWHTFDFETNGSNACFDGGTLQASTDGGSTWTVVPDAAFTAGGFNGTVSTLHSNPIGGLRGWCQGTLGAMTQVTANLSSFAGASSMKLRWNAGDDVSLAEEGWAVDSVTIANAGTASVCTGVPPVPLDFYTLAPCRLLDTRNADGPMGGPALQANANRSFTLAGACGIPSTAKAVALNVTVIGATGSGFLTLFPGNLSAPLASTINFVPTMARSNNATVQLSTNGSGEVMVRNGSAGTTHVILDVAGYYAEEEPAGNQ